MELTREQAIKEHRDMWNWIADNIEEMKPKYAKQIKGHYVEEIRGIKEEIYGYCFCCEYDKRYGNNCSHCPLDWGNKGNSCTCIDKSQLYSVFHEHVSLKQYDDASIIARKIANLPERK